MVDFKMWSIDLTSVGQVSANAEGTWLPAVTVWLDFVLGLFSAWLSFLAAAAWPLAIVIIALAMRRNLERLLARVQRLAGLGGEATFFTEAPAATAAAEEIAPMTIPPDSESSESEAPAEADAAPPPPQEPTAILRELVEAIRASNKERDAGVLPLDINIPAYFTREMVSVRLQIFQVAQSHGIAPRTLSQGEFRPLVAQLDEKLRARGTMVELYRVLEGMASEGRSLGSDITVENFARFNAAKIAFLNLLHTQFKGPQGEVHPVLWGQGLRPKTAAPADRSPPPAAAADSAPPSGE